MGLRIKDIAVALCTLLVTVAFIACGSGGQGDNAEPPDEADGTEVESAGAEDEQDEVVIEGPVAVVSNSYSLPDTTGYDTLVAFRIRNLNDDLAAEDVPYRVTITGGGETLHISDGSDSVSLGPGETRAVVYSVSGGIDGVQPEEAEVEVFSDPSLFVALDESSGSQWTVTNVTFICPEEVIACDATGSITWQGDEPQTFVRITVVARQGDLNGPIIAAGADSLDLDEVAPGQTVPFGVSMRGFLQPRPERPPVLPDGLIEPEVNVDSVDASIFD